MSAEAMVTLQERLTHLTEQLAMPIVEVSLVIGGWVNRLFGELEKLYSSQNMAMPEVLAQRWQIEKTLSEVDSEFSLERALSIVDKDRMEILDTLIEATLVETELNLQDALLVLRGWEQLLRSALSNITSAGQLFSPLEIPEDF